MLDDRDRVRTGAPRMEAGVRAGPGGLLLELRCTDRWRTRPLPGRRRRI